MGVSVLFIIQKRQHVLFSCITQLHQESSKGSRRWSLGYERTRHATINIITRLGLEKELTGHSGCVNCLEWNQQGRLLLSGSDDCCVILWDAFAHQARRKYRTTHTGNIFSVKFMPDCGDHLLATASADNNVTIIDSETGETINIFSCHRARVKRLAVSQELPHLLFSAGEDGCIMQFDLRCPEELTGDKPKNILVNLCNLTGPTTEAKCLDINPTQSHLLAVGANDHYTRVYDRRMLECTDRESKDDMPSKCVQYYVPGHIVSLIDSYSKQYRMPSATDVTFSPDGRELLVNLGSEQIYLYDLYERQSIQTFDTSNFGVSFESICASDSNGKLPTAIERIKQRANHEFERQHFGASIDLYSQAIEKAPSKAVLYSNRAAALLKRDWDSDSYAALRDCVTAISLDSRQYKAYYRLTRCLLSLKRVSEAEAALAYFKQKFPEETTGLLFDKLCRDVDSAVSSRQHLIENPQSRDIGMHIRGHCVRRSDGEARWRESALDYSQRFCGHCNLTTDIKEANFIGRNGQFICAGSDDGSFFIWDRHTANIVRVLKGDEAIVNCLQPHPEICVVASTGIDSTVKLWAPMEDDVAQERAIPVSKFGDAASANQKRMTADPLETMLIDMGYRLGQHHSSESQSDGEAASDGGGDMPCRPF